MSNRDAWIKRLEDEEASIVRQIEILEAKQSEARDRRCWLQCPCRYGDIVEVRGVSCHVVVVIPGSRMFIGAVLLDGRISHMTESVRPHSEPHKVVGRYTGPGLPPKPPEAEWAEKVLDGEMPAPPKPFPDESESPCPQCGLRRNNGYQISCDCWHCDECDAPLSDKDPDRDICDACSRESDTPEGHDE